MPRTEDKGSRQSPPLGSACSPECALPWPVGPHSLLALQSCPGLCHLSESRGWKGSCCSAPCMEITSYWTDKCKEKVPARWTSPPKTQPERTKPTTLAFWTAKKPLSLPGALSSKTEGKEACLKEHPIPQVPRGFYNIFNSFFPSFLVSSTLPSFCKHLLGIYYVLCIELGNRGP